MDVEVRWTRAKLTGRLMRSFRQSYAVAGRKAGLSQDGLLDLMGQADPGYFNTLDRSTVSKWETGSILPTRERLEVFGKALCLSRAEIDGLLDLAGLGSGVENSAYDGGKVKVEAVEGVTHEADVDGYGSVGPSFTGEIVRLVLAKFLLPGLAIAGAGYFLASVGWSADWILSTYIIVVICGVMSYHFLRLRRSSWLRDLLFVSVFVLLSIPMLQAPLIRMDPYGFYAIDGFSNTPIPYVLALLVNLLLALSAGLLFDFFWRWQYSVRTGNPFRQAALVSFPPLVFVYVCALLFCCAGTWIYLLEVFPVLGGVLMAILVLQHESIQLTEWAKRFLFQTCVAITIVLGSISLIAMVVVYWDPSLQLVPDHTLLRSWEVDFNALGYPPEEFADRGRVGLVWSCLAAIIYMVTFVGGSLMITICRKGNGDSADPAAAPTPVATSTAAQLPRKRLDQSKADMCYRFGWLARKSYHTHRLQQRRYSLIDPH